MGDGIMNGKKGHVRISGGDAVPESRFDQPGSEGVRSQFCRGHGHCLQHFKGPAMVNPSPGVPGLKRPEGGGAASIFGARLEPVS